MLQGTNENFQELALMKYSTEKQLKNVLAAIEIQDDSDNYAFIVTKYYQGGDLTSLTEKFATAQAHDIEIIARHIVL